MTKRPKQRPPTDASKAFGRRLDAALTESKKSQEDLAGALGVHENTVGKWVRAESDYPAAWLPSIAAFLGVPVHELIDDAPPPDVNFARRVVDVLERPLTAPDLMTLLAEAKARVADHT